MIFFYWQIVEMKMMKRSYHQISGKFQKGHKKIQNFLYTSGASAYFWDPRKTKMKNNRTFVWHLMITIRKYSKNYY